MLFVLGGIPIWDDVQLSIKIASSSDLEAIFIINFGGEINLRELAQQFRVDLQPQIPHLHPQVDCR